MLENSKATVSTQLIGKRHVLMSFFLYLVVATLLIYFQKLGTLELPAQLLFYLFAIAFAANLAFYLTIAAGTKILPNHTGLTLPQAAVATLLVIILGDIDIKAKGIILTAYLIIFIFGAFCMRMGQFLTLALFAFVGHGLVILLLAFSADKRIDLQTELAYWVSLLAVLPCFAILCQEINRLKERNCVTAKKLEMAEHRYKGLHDNMTDPVILIDGRGDIISANPAFLEAVGSTCDDQVCGKPIASFVPPYDSPLVDNLTRLKTGHIKAPFYINIVGAEGETREMECKACAVDGRGTDEYLLLNMRDITGRKKLQKRLEDSWEELEQTKMFTILGLAKLTEYRDKNTGDHLERICGYTKILAKQLSYHPRYKDYISEKYIMDIAISSALHDIGKVGLPDEILLKPGPLTDKEFEIVKRHSLLGGDAIETTEKFIRGESFLTLGKLIAYFHHERWDGSGYPFGLAGEEIPLCARIVGLADVYDALTTQRIYKEPVSHEKAKSIIIAERGKQFDPDVVDAFCAAENRIKALMEGTRKIS